MKERPVACPGLYPVPVPSLASNVIEHLVFQHNVRSIQATLVPAVTHRNVGRISPRRIDIGFAPASRNTKRIGSGQFQLEHLADQCKDLDVLSQLTSTQYFRRCLIIATLLYAVAT